MASIQPWLMRMNVINLSCFGSRFTWPSEKKNENRYHSVLITVDILLSLISTFVLPQLEWAQLKDSQIVE